MTLRGADVSVILAAIIFYPSDEGGRSQVILQAWYPSIKLLDVTSWKTTERILYS
jgi:hypothetical protein